MSTLTQHCIVSGGSFATDEMVRFVLDPQGKVVPDILGRLPGRGVWIVANRHVLLSAVKNEQVFKRAFYSSTLTVPQDLLDKTIALQTKRCLELLAMARKNGGVVTGYHKVRNALVCRNVEVLVEAWDVSENGKRKLLLNTDGIPVIDVFSRTQLGKVLGRDIAVHVALLPVGITERFCQEVGKLLAMLG